jgi:malate dehydrogenase (oxaloacetate-decarboxylating)(NADP+)
MIKRMAPRPIIFALANPDPEIPYPDARDARPDAILATGRSDYPNQINNVLGFPFIFRGLLDCRARRVNQEIKLAAVQALAVLAREDVPEEVIRAYGGSPIRFGPDYIIPKPFDYRVLLRIAPAVVEAAIATGVARRKLDLEEYVTRLQERLGKTRALARGIAMRARQTRKRVVYPEGEHDAVIRAAAIVESEGIGRPALVGNPKRIRARMETLRVKTDTIDIVDPRDPERIEPLAAELFQLRQRKGVTMSVAREQVQNPPCLAALLVHRGEADALICGVDHHYPDTLRPALQIIGLRPDVSIVAGLYLVVLRDNVYFFADTTVNIDPTSEMLAEIAILAAAEARKFNIVPRVAMLSFSNFGSVRHPLSEKVRRATEIVREREPELEIDGEMAADTAVTPALVRENYPFSTLKGAANVLVFPNLEAGNIAYKLLRRTAGAEVIGPIFMGMRKPVYAVETGADANQIVTMTAIALVG